MNAPQKPDFEDHFYKLLAQRPPAPGSQSSLPRGGDPHFPPARGRGGGVQTPPRARRNSASTRLMLGCKERPPSDARHRRSFALLGGGGTHEQPPAYFAQGRSRLRRKLPSCTSKGFMSNTKSLPLQIPAPSRAQSGAPSPATPLTCRDGAAPPPRAAFS